MNNNNVSDKELLEAFNKMHPDMMVRNRPVDRRTNFQKFRDGTASFLNENKGVALITLTSYAVARNSGKTHDQALESAAYGMKHGKKLENMYNWCVSVIKS